jgi:signal transduction histidine kinase
MQQQLTDHTTEVKRLQRCMNDLVSVLALPAVWSVSEPSRILDTLLDALMGILDLDFLYARVRLNSHEVPIDALRTAPLFGASHSQQEIGRALNRGFGEDPQQGSEEVLRKLGGGEVSVFPVRMGIEGDLGLILAGSQRAGFPEQTESLVLSVAANQAAIGLQQALRLDEQKRVSIELDRRVAERTRELAETMHDWKQAQEELRDTQAELARMMRATTIGLLTASIAHEVNQPLSGIVTNASTCLRMLKSNPPNIDGALETAQRTIRDGNRASEVIARLRTLFSKKQIDVEPIDLNEAAREVIALLSGELQRNNVILKQEFCDRLPTVNGDRVQLQQVILNLLRNASDAMSAIEDRPRQIVLRTDLVGENVCLSVQDSGVGFTPEVAGKMFESFYTTKPDGMGLGLSVSRSIIEASHGRLWATANDGPGATFAFSIPCEHGSRSQEGTE